MVVREVGCSKVLKVEVSEVEMVAFKFRRFDRGKRVSGFV